MRSRDETYTIDPEYQRELYREVRGARYVGYEISVTSMGAALAIVNISVD